MKIFKTADQTALEAKIYNFCQYYRHVNRLHLLYYNWFIYQK